MKIKIVITAIHKYIFNASVKFNVYLAMAVCSSDFLSPCSNRDRARTNKDGFIFMVIKSSSRPILRSFLLAFSIGLIPQVGNFVSWYLKSKLNIRVRLRLEMLPFPSKPWPSITSNVCYRV